MEIALVNKSDLGLGAPKGLRGDKAAKPAAEDKHTMFVSHVPHPEIESAKVVPTGQTASLFR